VSDITKIHEKALREDFVKRIGLDHFSIAQRMSWAARRQTTREEDRSYSLLGIFEINMPMLYGEGRSAFRRLQEEIMRRSDDQSILAWNPIGSPVPGCFLAPLPDYFWHSGKVISKRQTDIMPLNLTSKGLRIDLPVELPKQGDDYRLILDCQLEGQEAVSLCLIVKPDVSHSDTSPTYVRKNEGMLYLTGGPPPTSQRQPIFLNTFVYQSQPVDTRIQPMFIDMENIKRDGFEAVAAFPSRLMEGDIRVRSDLFLIASGRNDNGRVLGGAVHFIDGGGRFFTLRLQIVDGILQSQIIFSKWSIDDFRDPQIWEQDDKSGRLEWYNGDKWGIKISTRQRLRSNRGTLCILLDLI
jgi:hypothetical protein